MIYQKEIQTIREQLIGYISSQKSMFVTSSFQTHSIPMLHIISQIDKKIPIYFLNTGYLFPQTIVYKDLIKDIYGLNIIDIKGTLPEVCKKTRVENYFLPPTPTIVVI